MVSQQLSIQHFLIMAITSIYLLTNEFTKNCSSTISLSTSCAATTEISLLCRCKEGPVHIEDKVLLGKTNISCFRPY